MQTSTRLCQLYFHFLCQVLKTFQDYFPAKQTSLLVVLSHNDPLYCRPTAFWPLTPFTGHPATCLKWGFSNKVFCRVYYVVPVSSWLLYSVSICLLSLPSCRLCNHIKIQTRLMKCSPKIHSSYVFSLWSHFRNKRYTVDFCISFVPHSNNCIWK